jgi:hypothetical protein
MPTSVNHPEYDVMLIEAIQHTTRGVSIYTIEEYLSDKYHLRSCGDTVPIVLGRLRRMGCITQDIINGTKRYKLGSHIFLRTPCHHLNSMLM